MAVADFDNDGRLDLFVSNANTEPKLVRNVLPTGAAFFQLDLVGTSSNPSAVGTRVRLTAGGRTRVSFVNGGNGFASQSSRRIHFGLGSESRVEKLEVLWPSGKVQIFENLAAGIRYRLVEGEKNLEPVSNPPETRKEPAS